MDTGDNVDLIVNCYERTYQNLLAPGTFASIEAANERTFHSRIALINNVTNPDHAAALADSRVAAGEIDLWHFVADLMPSAVRVAHLSRRTLRRHPYLLDYGVAMGVAATAEYVLGWDAEVCLETATDWVTGAVELLDRRPDVFSASCRWPSRDYDTLEDETVARDGVWRLNWGFSDQLFLVRKAELTSPIYRQFSPGAWARHADHPWTFESRLEAYQRSAKRYRATTPAARFIHNDSLPEVVHRLGGRSGGELIQHQVLKRLRTPLQRVSPNFPRWSTQ